MLQLLVRERVVDLRRCPRRRASTSAWRYAISPARRAATASPQCRLSRLGASWLHPTPSTQTDAWRPRSSVASTVTTQPSVLRAVCSLVSGSNSDGGVGDVRVRGSRVRRRVLAVPGGDLGALRGRAAALVQVAAHLQPGDGERRYAQRAVEHRIEREALDPAVRDHVGRLRVGLDRHDPGDARPDQHHGGRDREQPVRSHGLHRSLDRAELVRHVLVEDARPLFEVLGRADERVDLACGRRCRRPRTRSARPRTSAPCTRPRTWWGRSRTSRSRPPRLAAPSPRLYRVGVQDVVWSPSPEYVERANVTRFMRAHGIETYEELVARSVGDIVWFWDAVVRDLGISFLTPYEQVLDTSRGVEWATWFTGGKTNVAHQCVDVWARSNPRGGRGRVGGRGRRRPPGHLSGAPRADRPAGARAAIARRRGNATRSASSCRWRSRPWPRSWRAPSSGAIWVPIFSGFGPEAVAARLADAGAKVLITADGTLRRGRPVPMKEIADRAANDVVSVEHVLVWSRLGDDDVAAGTTWRDVRWEELVAAQPGTLRHRTARQRTPALHRLHERDDRHAEGRAARPRRLPGEDRGRGRVPGRRPTGRRPALGDGPRLDHGAVGDRRRARAWVRPWCSPKERRTSRVPIGCGRRSSVTASRRWASRRR